MIWKDIEGYDYQVSDEGEVRSKDRMNNTSHNAVRFLKGKIIKQHKINSGYKTVGLHKDGKVKNCFVHRLVYEAFVGPIPKGMCCNHINENKEDNRLCNLNLLSYKGNANWGTTHQRAIKHIEKLRKRIVCYKDSEPFMCFKSISDAAAEFNTTIQNISIALRTGNTACGCKWEYYEAIR